LNAVVEKMERDDAHFVRSIAAEMIRSVIGWRLATDT